MGLESDVAKVLRNEPAGRINFKVDTVAVNKSQLESVAKAIENGDIAVKIGDTGSLLGAAYSSWKTRRWGPDEKKLTGEITLGSTKAINDVIGRAGIFHESVHAMMDVKSIKVSMHDDEVVAYLADALYLKASQRTNISGKPEDVAIYKAAFAIVDSHRMLTKGGVTLKSSECDALRNAIKANSAYR